MNYSELQFAPNSLFLVTGGAGFIGSNLCEALKEYNVDITVYDPWANPAIAKREYGIDIVNELPAEKFDAAIAAVAHKKFEALDVLSLLKDMHVIFDVKCTLDRSIVDGRL